MKVISNIFLILNFFYFFSCGEMKHVKELNVLFLSAGSGEPNTSHNGKINHHKLKPSFLRHNINIIYSSDLNSLNANILPKYDVIIMYLSAANEKPERISYTKLKLHF